LRTEAWQWFIRGLAVSLAAAIVVALAVAFVSAVHVLVLVVVAVLLATGLEPAIAWLRVRTHLRRGVTILLVYGAFFATVAILLLLVVPTAVGQLQALGARLPALLDQIRAWASTQSPAIAEGVDRLLDAISATTSSVAVSNPQDILNAGAALAEAVISVTSVLALVFFWLTGHQHMQRFALALLPAERRRGVREAWNQVESRLGLWVRGQLILMGFMFVATSIAWFLIGLEGALLLGLLAGLAEVIPIAGPTLGAIPALMVAATSGRIEVVLLVVAVYMVIQLVEANALMPIVMRNSIGVPPFLVVLALLVGAAVGGIAGAFLAVPLAAAITVILEHAQARDVPVPLDVGSTEQTPNRTDRDRLERSSADSPGVAAHG
jgi:predicted PurR-regulated permease PerM